ncbi:hypothetical protein [Hyphomicrobium sp.]|jgi:hypothetical protein|uniref:hypothetical protein n=1 Tax=Hyphomicrobium sp. TaxID=82 RepID=UPI002FE319CF
MDLTQLLIQAASGAIGGNAAAAVTKNDSLGTLGNTIAGALGGGIVGQLLGSLLGLGGAAATSGLDVNAVVNGFATGGVGGAVTALVLGIIKLKLVG